ncbi:glycerate kinase family protein [Algoriphagus marinus]|uniref:glycerate kinase family protein n=1 Tax=Algoriphagus marinus TaxID=1925762 RepID=UPI00094B8195|nr:glycerate kinase [Algoriphagus marinus]
MNVLISPNAFKGTITADKVGEIIQSCIKERYPEYQTKIVPLADGGDGTCSLLTKVLNLEYEEFWTLNAYGRPIRGAFGWNDKDKTAYIDISVASGLGSLQNQHLDPFVASTFGTGMILQKAIERGAQHIVLGLGGSASIDLGTGILAALGILMLDEKGRELTPFSPNYLSKIKHIQFSPRLPKIEFTLLCDVRNFFFGKNGAIQVFGPQKGLNPEEADSFEKTCEEVLLKFYNKSKKEFIEEEGFGAAGGIAAGLSAFFPCEIKMGSSYFFKKVKLPEYVDWADLIITGEGKYDTQSKGGKASFELLQLAKNQGKKIALITGGDDLIEDDFDLIIRLPNLDFSKPDYASTAKLNLVASFKSNFNSRFWT